MSPNLRELLEDADPDRGRRRGHAARRARRRFRPPLRPREPLPPGDGHGYPRGVSEGRRRRHRDQHFRRQPFQARDPRPRREGARSKRRGRQAGPQGGRSVAGAGDRGAGPRGHRSARTSARPRRSRQSKDEARGPSFWSRPKRSSKAGRTRSSSRPSPTSPSCGSPTRRSSLWARRCSRTRPSSRTARRWPKGCRGGRRVRSPPGAPT